MKSHTYEHGTVDNGHVGNVGGLKFSPLSLLIGLLNGI